METVTVWYEFLCRKCLLPWVLTTKEQEEAICTCREPLKTAVGFITDLPNDEVKTALAYRKTHWVEVSISPLIDR